MWLNEIRLDRNVIKRTESMSEHQFYQSCTWNRESSARLLRRPEPKPYNTSRFKNSIATGVGLARDCFVQSIIDTVNILTNHYPTQNETSSLNCVCTCRRNSSFGMRRGKVQSYQLQRVLVKGLLFSHWFSHHKSSKQSIFCSALAPPRA